MTSDPADTTRSDQRGPLSGLTVIDAGTRISAPFCAGLLADLGADVIKVEQPGTGDVLRSIGPFDGDRSLWFAVEGRSRRSVTCDLRKEAGQQLFRRLASHADVLIENFRPGTMEAWGLGPDDLAPELVYVRVSAFGTDGPYAGRPGLDRVGIGYGGLLHLTGEPDRAPMRVGVNISDYLSGTFAAVGALATLWARDRSTQREGDVIDASLYGSVMRILEWTIPAYDRLDVVRGREGNRLGIAAPGNNYGTADGRYVSIVAGSDANFARLCAAMEREDLLDDPRFSDMRSRAQNGDAIDDIVTHWAASLPAEALVAACVEAGVPAAPDYTAADIVADPHVQERQDVILVDDPVVGPVAQQAPQPRLRRRPAAPPRGAPELGQDNEHVWRGLVGLSLDEYESAVAQKVI